MCEFLTTVTEGVVHGVYKVVTRSFFSVTRQYKGVEVLGILPRVHLTATKGELRLMEVAFR